MPLSRVLDITVDRPLWLRPLRAGHLTLENAAQEQGLREFRFIPHPNERALRIHALRTGSSSAPTPSGPVEPPGRRADLARLGLRAMLGGALASWTTATIAGILL